jgi:FKBP-type peptidyl-prolyl cis-trans isomerase
LRVENARPPGPGTELPDASRVNQTAFTQRQSGTTDRRSAEKLMHNTLQPGRSPAEFTSRSSNRDAIRGAFFTETSTKPQLSTKSSSSTASARGVIKELIMPGDGITKAKAGDYVTIEYTSKFLDGKQYVLCLFCY